MSEQEAIHAINERCRTGDYEANGCELDEIVDDFLRGLGYGKLADVIASVDCWRA